MTIKIKKTDTSRSKLANKRVDKKKQEYDEIMSDFIVFCEKFVKIVDNYSKLVPFVLNDDQRDFVLNMGKYNLILKARQLGFSVTSLALTLFSAINKPHTSYLIVSHDNKQVSELFNRLKRMNDHLPRDTYPYFPDTLRDNRDELLLTNGSRIQVSAPSPTLGRGSTYEYILLSEFAYYPDTDQSTILSGVTNSLSKNPNSQIVIETTARGLNFFYDLYTKSEKGKPIIRFSFFLGYQQLTEHCIEVKLRKLLNGTK